MAVNRLIESTGPRFYDKKIQINLLYVIYEEGPTKTERATPILRLGHGILLTNLFLDYLCRKTTKAVPI